MTAAIQKEKETNMGVRLVLIGSWCKDDGDEKNKREKWATVGSNLARSSKRIDASRLGQLNPVAKKGNW